VGFSTPASPLAMGYGLQETNPRTAPHPAPKVQKIQAQAAPKSRENPTHKGLRQTSGRLPLLGIRALHLSKTPHPQTPRTPRSAVARCQFAQSCARPLRTKSRMKLNPHRGR